jgi:hypothetical protein
MQGILWLDGNMKNAASLDRMIGAWKGWVAIGLRKYHRDAQIACLSYLWERGYYEHIIRNVEDLELTREYIMNNPLKALLMQEQRYEEMKRARVKGEGGRP